MERNAVDIARAALALGALVLALAAPAATARVGRDVTPAPAAGGYSVTLEQCVRSSVQSERSATFVAQMAATPTTGRMSMRIDVQQRLHGEAEFRTVLAPGLGVWRSAEPGVKVYRYVKQITNLQAPAAYRALVRFRWVDGSGRTVKRAEAIGVRCFQPAQAR